jgi:hypothetical protein
MYQLERHIYKSQIKTQYNLPLAQYNRYLCNTYYFLIQIKLIKF